MWPMLSSPMETDSTRFKELHFRQYADIAEAKLRQQTDLIYAQTGAQVVIDSQAGATKRAQKAMPISRSAVMWQRRSHGTSSRSVYQSRWLGTMAGGRRCCRNRRWAMSDALVKPPQFAGKVYKMWCTTSGECKVLSGVWRKVAPAILKIWLSAKCSTVAKGKFCLGADINLLRLAPIAAKKRSEPSSVWNAVRSFKGY